MTPTKMLRCNSVKAVCIDWYDLTMNSITERKITNGDEW